ncbi:MAG: exosortase/archaeosortase family protein [Verrucomicrobia bacterium]|nr:exosortase/archaeosortase family protein [Verrucomicrobiota bacterium]
MTTAASLPPHGSLAVAWHRLPWIGRIAFAGLGLAMIALSFRLWPEWRHNPDLSHGFFIPVVFLILLHEARGGTARWLGRGPLFHGLLAALLTGALLALVAAGLYAASVDWSHALVNLSLTLSFVLFLGAGLVLSAGEATRLLPLNWTALVAPTLWLACTPIPPGTYSRLTLSLQLFVSENTVGVLHVLGVAAVRHGNIIELARATVGVEEACSGVRSLLSCLFAGLFFSATLVRRPWARALIVGLSAPLALAMNFLRSLSLTLLANAGVDIAGPWHDATGFAVLGVTAALLGGLALLLEHRERPAAAPQPSSAPAAPGDRPRTMPFAALVGALAVAAALTAFFFANTRPATRGDRPIPDLLAVLPARAPGWTVDTDTDLYQFRSTLRTEFLAQRTYTRQRPTGLEQVTLYLAYWRPGQAPVSLVASHTPDACWPGSGWTMVAAPPPPSPLVIGGRTLAPPEHRLFRSSFSQHVWFWHLYGGRPITYRDPYSAVELLRIAWRYGFRKDGEQLFVRVSSNRPLESLAPEPLFIELFAQLGKLGL